MLVENLKLVDERYLLQQELRAYGPVELYFALDRQLERLVVLEMLSASAAKDRAMCDRFNRHQRSASAIHHPNVIEVYDAGEWNGRPYLVMERDAGQPPLSEAVVKDIAPDLAAALRMTRQVAEALAFCRQAGLDDWPFSYQAVRIGASGHAQIAILEESDVSGPHISRHASSDPPALAALFRLLISAIPGTPDTQSYPPLLPASMAEVLQRLEPGTPASFADAGEAAEALKELEAASNDYTQVNELVQPNLQVPAIVSSSPDMQRTSSLAEAPTLAVDQQGVIQSIPYLPDLDSSTTPRDTSKPYVPNSLPVGGAPNRKRRVAAYLLLPLLGLLLLVAGAAAFAPRPGEADPGPMSNNQAALSTATALPTAIAELVTPATVPVAVPDLLGKSLDEATSTAEVLGIGLSVIDPVHSGEVALDMVAVQDPAPGTELSAGGIVVVALSMGPEPIQQIEEEGDDEDEDGAAPPPEKKQGDDKKKNNGKKR